MKCQKLIYYHHKNSDGFVLPNFLQKTGNVFFFKSYYILWVSRTFNEVCCDHQLKMMELMTLEVLNER